MQKSFEEIKNDFINSNIEEKIKIFITADSLSSEQFKELLNYFPIKQLDRLEKAVMKN